MSLNAGTGGNQTIFIRNGVYDEQVYIPTLREKLIIYGETIESVLHWTVRDIFLMT